MTRSPTAPESTPTRRARPAIEQHWLHTHRGARLRLRLLDGKVLTGTLQGWDAYTLELVLDGGRDPVLVFKHAVAYLCREVAA